MRLVERHIVRDNRFEDICFKSGLLYNYVLYNIRQGIFSGNYLKEFDLSNKLCKENQFDFRNLPNHVSQQVIKQVFKNIKSWMRLKKDFEKNPSKYGNHRPHLPSYKKGKKQNMVVFTNCDCRIKDDGYIHFVNRALVENLIKTFETMQDIYSNNYRLKVYTGNCIIQLNVNPKDPSESFFDVYDRDEMKLIYGIKISILKEMFII